jgi:inositol-phosphate phosphatase/L-galactose 1-phosphate phosphatase/histidinol-phosphatase
MPTSNKDIDKYLKFALHLADISEKIIKKHFRKNNLIELKEDASPVTEIDREVESSLIQAILKKFPHHGIMSEEFGEENKNAEIKWIIDPIDGTKSFIQGKPIFTTLIGLMINSEVIIGIINQPITKERFVGVTKKGAGLNKRPIFASDCRTIHQARFATTSPYLFEDKVAGKIKKLSEQAKVTSYGGDAYNYAMLASGFIDLVIESGLKTYDILPIIPIINEAGGVIMDFKGNLLKNKVLQQKSYDVIVASNEVLAKEAVAWLKK